MLGCGVGLPIIENEGRLGRGAEGERREEITPAHRLWPVAKCAVHGQLHEHYRHLNYTVNVGSASTAITTISLFPAPRPRLPSVDRAEAVTAEGKSAILALDAAFHRLKFLLRQRNTADEANLDGHADLGCSCELC